MTTSKVYVLKGTPKALARPRFTANRVFDSQRQLKLLAGLDFVDNKNEFFCSPQCADNLIEEEHLMESDTTHIWINRC